MERDTRHAMALLASVAMLTAGQAIVAQSPLAQLGLTEVAARNFVMSEIKSPTTSRRSDIVLAGTRGFLKLPPAARGPAATALFAWAKAYVNSASFKTAYASVRRDALPTARDEPTVDEEVGKAMDQFREQIAAMRRAAVSMPPAAAAQFLKSVEAQDAQVQSGELEKSLRAQLEAQRSAQNAGADASARAANDRYPADPRTLFAHRLQEFLDATADADFSARTISLTGGPDGVELVERADQKRSWMWQEAVIVGREATTAARASAEAWLKEIEP
jgi:hypothetical protein